MSGQIGSGVLIIENSLWFLAAAYAASVGATARGATRAPQAGPRLLQVQPRPPARSSNLPGLPKFLSLAKPAGARGAGLGVSGAYDDPRMACGADCRDVLQANQARGVTQAVLAGAAAAGVGAGVVLLLTAPARSAKSPVTPALGVGLALQKISASALWRF